MEIINNRTEDFEDDVSTKEVMALVKSYSQIKESKIRKKVLALVQSLSKEENLAKEMVDSL